MLSDDTDDTHLCIKCNATIVGLDNYIQHRRANECNSGGNITSSQHKISVTGTSPVVVHNDNNALQAVKNRNREHPYDSFAFTEPEPPLASEHGGKTSKSLSDAYELPFELGEELFFMSLELQRMQSVVPSTGGKTTNNQQQGLLQRQRVISPLQHESAEHAVDTWMSDADTPHGSSNVGNSHHNSERLMKAIDNIKAPLDSVFTRISFANETPEESEDDVDDDCVADMVDTDVDEDFDAHESGGKWKLPLLHNSPPVVPATHTGGKWKPESRPNLSISHAQLTRLSPNWDDQAFELETGEHPPADHTKGKWIPGTKVQRLEYREEMQLAQTKQRGYWCNICSRKLRSKIIYENHLKSNYHLKRADVELQLEKATFSNMQNITDKGVDMLLLQSGKPENEVNSKKQLRRKKFIRCDICRHMIVRQLIGKHLISHYHYRRMQQFPEKSFRLILDNIHAIVFQSPFQCRPCRFYTNTEEHFLEHWNSSEHLDATEGPGKFCCSYCYYECEDNNQMRRHLTGQEHKEVVNIINRSVPICISKRLSIDCSKCRLSFRYNKELREHILLEHAGFPLTGTVSDAYQSRYNCTQCTQVFQSKVSLLRHEKNAHFILKYFCSICNLEFQTPCKARAHRKTAEHRKKAASMELLKADRKPKSIRIVAANLSTSNKCEKCSFVSETEVEAMLHELSHVDFKTDIKVEPATSTNILPKRNRKSKSIKNEEILICRDCKETFKDRELLKMHRQVQHPHSAYVCISCGESFAVAQALGRHSRNCHATTKIVSKNCANNAIIEENLDHQSVWHCEICHFRTNFKAELIFHRLHHTMGTVHKNQLIECPLCPKSMRKVSLRFHIRQHTNEKFFKCQHCNACFSRPYNLKEHLQKLHPASVVGNSKLKSKPFGCDACNKVFKSKHSLLLHRKTHEEAQPKFVCHFKGCAFKTNRQSVLTCHFFTHNTHSKDFKCSHENCAYKGKSYLHLKRHFHTHLKTGRLYKCDQCSFAAKTKIHLRRHMASHSIEKPFQCPYCSFCCNSQDNLRKHVLKTGKHPGKYMYVCKVYENDKNASKQLSQKYNQEQYGEQPTTSSGVKRKKCVFETNSYLEFKQHLKNVHAKK